MALVKIKLIVMSYELTMQKAGAEVLGYKETGSYQGSWYAVVRYGGLLGVAEGSYGSCSVCDSFLGEFDFDDNKPTEYEGKYFKGEWYHEDEISKEEYDSLLAEYDKRLADFGRSYLMNLSDRNMIETRLSVLRASEENWSFEQEEIEGLEWCLNELNKYENS